MTNPEQTDIPNPSNKEVSKCYKKWKKLEDYPKYECFLKKLFTEIYPKNNNEDEVLIKISSLDSLYSTNVVKHVNAITLAKHITSREDIDQRFKNSDFTLVNEIALVESKKSKKKTINVFSFATKYCSLHFQDDYPIYDSNVENMLNCFNERNKFANFTTDRNCKDSLNQHPKFYDVMKEFRKFHKLEADLRKIEKYLWYAAKYKYKRILNPKKSSK